MEPMAKMTLGMIGGSLKVATTLERIRIVKRPKYGTRSRIAASNPSNKAYLISITEKITEMMIPWRTATVSTPRI